LNWDDRGTAQADRGSDSPSPCLPSSPPYNSPGGHLQLQPLYSAFVFAFCMLHLLGDRRAGKTLKLLWGLLLVVGNVLVFPLYWFFRVRPAKEG